MWSAILALIAVGGLIAAQEIAAKLHDIRYRLQLLEARNGSLGRLEAIEVEREQLSRGAARFNARRHASPFGHGRWEMIGSPETVSGWPDEYVQSKALAVHQDRLYVGLSRPGRATAQVWRFDGTAWDKIGGEELGAAWARLSHVTAFATDGTTLYAGINDTVWTYDRERGWRKIGGDGQAGSWASGQYTNAYSLAVHGGRLVVGMTGGRQAAVYSYASGRWEKVAGEGIRSGWAEDRYTGVYELWSHSDGFLYAGLIANPGPTAVFRFDGIRWEKIGGDGIYGSWRHAGFTYALSFASLDGQLVVSMNRHPMIEGNFSSVWAFDGKEWKPVGLGHIPGPWGEMHNYNALAAYERRLVIGAGGIPAGNASVWEVEDGVRPVLVGGHGVKASWGKRTAFDILHSANAEYVYRFVIWRGDLIAGFGIDPGSANVWRFRPARDSRVPPHVATPN